VITIGRALPTFNSCILNKDGKEDLIGELCISGVSIAEGYLNLPEANRKFKCLENYGRTFFTGDMVEVRKNIILWIGLYFVFILCMFLVCARYLKFKILWESR
jgi:acyl-CoA synthetase (AMP-forming)/AMP-acid ligase II